MKNTGLADSPLFFKLKSQKEKKEEKSIHHETMVSGDYDTTIASISKAIQDVGKQASTFRFTLREKTSMVKVIYSFRLKNTKITENDIVRIAINLLISDYKDNRSNSILSKVIYFPKK